MTQAPTLNAGQQAASDAFFDFLMSQEKTFVISGSAGVGKTFLMGHLSNQIMSQYEMACALTGIKPEITQVAYTATTNKAAEVLEQALGKPVQTIHSFMGLKVQNDYRTGKTKITKTQNFKVRQNLLLFIEECSMIDTTLYDFIMEGFVNCKIVFVGDHAQMAPVNEDLSPLYEHVPVDNFVTLTEPVRNAGQPALMALCSQLRNTVETGVFSPIVEVPGVIDYLDDTSMPFHLEQEFKDLNPSSRMLCYTNERVADYNEFIREDVRGLPPGFSVGDIVVVATAYQMGKISLSVEREVRIAELGPVEQDTSWDNHQVIEYQEATLVDVNSGSRFEGIRIPVNREFVNRMIKSFAGRKDWSSYFDLKALYIDLRDKAACTVYKSQGSTYDSVFIDIGNIGCSFDAKQVARMLFVAVSRARSRVFLYGTLPSRYHNSQGVPLWTDVPTSLAS